MFFLAIDCGPPQPLLNGTLSGEMTDYPNIVKLTCDMGFILRGPPLIKCQENGAWSWIGAFCEGTLPLRRNPRLTFDIKKSENPQRTKHLDNELSLQA